MEEGELSRVESPGRSGLRDAEPPEETWPFVAGRRLADVFARAIVNGVLAATSLAGLPSYHDVPHTGTQASNP